eukprot:1097735-Prymnesium_polylepis.1
MVHGRLLGHDAPGVSLVNKTWEICEHGAYRDTLQMQPVTSDWETGWEGTGGDLLRVLWYFIQLMWAFSGVAIIADIFMTAIEEITMATYVKTGKDGKKRVCKVWCAAPRQRGWRARAAKGGATAPRGIGTLPARCPRAVLRERPR